MDLNFSDYSLSFIIVISCFYFHLIKHIVDDMYLIYGFIVRKIKKLIMVNYTRDSSNNKPNK